MISRYLYSKVKESNTKFIPLHLDSNEINFLQSHHITFFQKKENIYDVNSDELKKLFCH